MTFEQPVYVGNLVVLHATVTWTGRTSIETEVSIEAEDVLSGEVRHISTAYFVYVATDKHGRPTPVRPLDVTTPAQGRHWKEAEQRRATVRHSDSGLTAHTVVTLRIFIEGMFLSLAQERSGGQHLRGVIVQPS